MACNESSSKQFFMPFSDLWPQVWFSRWSKEPSLNFQLFACTSHTRFGKPSSSFNIISNRAFILDTSLSRLAFFLPNQCYSMVAISHREYAKAAQRCRAIYYFNFVRAHTPKQWKRQKHAILINQKHISMHQALFLPPGTRLVVNIFIAVLMWLVG